MHEHERMNKCIMNLTNNLNITPTQHIYCTWRKVAGPCGSWTQESQLNRAAISTVRPGVLQTEAVFNSYMYHHIVHGQRSSLLSHHTHKLNTLPQVQSNQQLVTHQPSPPPPLPPPTPPRIYMITYIVKHPLDAQHTDRTREETSQTTEHLMC